jgi:hypothetical protein
MYNEDTRKVQLFRFGVTDGDHYDGWRERENMGMEIEFTELGIEIN